MIEGQGGVKLYADDLAICARDLVSMQEAMNRLHTFCTDNKLAVNVGKTKSVKFRREKVTHCTMRGGKLSLYLTLPTLG